MAANMTREIISDHRERMLNLKKYYPFFRLMDISFGSFKDGAYDILDMGYIVMAVLRFFIEENNFKEKQVTYPEYVGFMTELVKRDFGLDVTDSQAKEIADFVFDKMKNDGKPFEFSYFDPVDKKKRVSRMKVLESEIRNSTVWYSISADAVEFYLDTKEIKDESKISVAQLLLEKMIKSDNFKGGCEVVQRINDEVKRLKIKKNQVLAILQNDVFAGIESYREFVDTGMKWFEDEERLFAKNSELIEKTMSRLESSGGSGESYYRSISEVYELENQMKAAMQGHSELLSACTEMQKLTDDAVRRAKLGRLRSRVDFDSMLQDMIKSDNADILMKVINPLFKLKTKKTFNVIMIDDALNSKPTVYEKAEKIVEEKPEEIVFDDELEDERIKHNYSFLMDNLELIVGQKEKVTLNEFGEEMSKKYSPDILKNADYYSFFVNICKDENDEKRGFDIIFDDKDAAGEERITGNITFVKRT